MKIQVTPSDFSAVDIASDLFGKSKVHDNWPSPVTVDDVSQDEIDIGTSLLQEKGYSVLVIA